MRLTLLVISLLVISTTCLAQDAVKVVVEEIRIPVTAKDSTGRFDPTVGINDLLIKDNGVTQPLKSVYRTPASVMLLVDTGEELNRAKNTRLTREVGTALIGGLQTGDQIAVMQINNRVELLRPWTTAQADAIKSLDKLLPGKRTALLDGLIEAVEQFESIPPGNRHLVLISDGVDRAGTQTDLTAAFEHLLASNVTLHVISYASLGAKVRAPEPTRPRVKSAVAPELIEALPSTRHPGDPTPDLKTQLKNKGGAVLDLDLIFRRKGIKGALMERSEQFALITDETGGNLWLPSSAEQMIREARDVARDIDSQYVVSYKPVPPLERTTTTEYRPIEVISRRAGLTLRAPRGYIITNSSTVQ